MPHETFTLKVNDEEIDELYHDLIRLEVELAGELASMFRLHLQLVQQADGTWPYVDDERLDVWKPVTIEAGFGDESEELLRGYITHLLPHFDPDPATCTLEVWGMDSSVLMDREEKLKDWPDKRDSDIASEIFGQYGLAAEVEDTTVVHDQAVSTIIQRESDIQFLRRLARRNGYECYVQGESGYFRPPQLDATPQPLLAAHFGDETTLLRFDIEVDALAPVNVAAAQLDRTSKEVVEAQSEASQQSALGASDAASLLGSGIDPALVILDRVAATGAEEMAALTQGLYHAAEWFVTGEGEIDATEYGHVLMPHQTVTIKGIGERYSGVYYVTHVTHVLTPASYVQRFRTQRNALMPTGDEKFGADEGLLGGLL